MRLPRLPRLRVLENPFGWDLRSVQRWVRLTWRRPSAVSWKDGRPVAWRFGPVIVSRSGR